MESTPGKAFYRLQIAALEATNLDAFFGPCPPAIGEKDHSLCMLYTLGTDHLQDELTNFDLSIFPGQDQKGLNREGGHSIGSQSRRCFDEHPGCIDERSNS
jgi:hypothetical protein